MAARIKTKYPGVYYREGKRIGRPGLEKIYYIVFKKDGKVYEEKVGRQFKDDMTPARAAGMRAERIEGKRLSRKEFRQQKKAERNKWTINRLWQEYKAARPDLRDLGTDEARFRKYIQPHFGSKEPKIIVPLDVDRLRIVLSKEKKPATVRAVLEILRRTVNFGVKRQLCEGLVFPITMPKVNNVTTEDLDERQLIRLLEVLEHDRNRRIANMMKLALLTGMRRGELFRLKWQDIDFRRGFITIRDPKGGMDQQIPLNLAARRVFKEQPKTSEYVFPGRGKGHLTNIKKAANRIKREAGLPKDFRPLHGLRHVYASTLASSGRVDMYTLQKLLTHKSPQMTQRYAHLRDEALRKASNLAGKLIGGMDIALDKARQNK